MAISSVCIISFKILHLVLKSTADLSSIVSVIS